MSQLCQLRRFRTGACGAFEDQVGGKGSCQVACPYVLLLMLTFDDGTRILLSSLKCCWPARQLLQSAPASAKLWERKCGRRRRHSRPAGWQAELVAHVRTRWIGDLSFKEIPISDTILILHAPALPHQQQPATTPLSLSHPESYSKRRIQNENLEGGPRMLCAAAKSLCWCVCSTAAAYGVGSGRCALETDSSKNVLGIRQLALLRTMRRCAWAAHGAHEDAGDVGARQAMSQSAGLGPPLFLAQAKSLGTQQRTDAVRACLALICRARAPQRFT
eukprot:365082-Chlamydomonas_euryale.AAC.7